MNGNRTDPESGCCWVGWHRPALPNSHWRAVCQAESYDAAADLLAVLAGPGHRCVLCYPRQPPEVVQEDWQA
jgi:hypothetical protein